MSGEVRLWHVEPNGDDSWRAVEDGDPERPNWVLHIALPAAKHAALMRVVEAARSLGPLDPMRGNRRVLRVSLESICALRDALSAYRALNATAPERRGDSAKDGRKEAT